MKITYDQVKRAATLDDRSLDFEDAEEVFAGKTLDFRTNATITARCGSSRSESCAAAW